MKLEISVANNGIIVSEKEPGYAEKVKNIWIAKTERELNKILRELLWAVKNE